MMVFKEMPGLFSLMGALLVSVSVLLTGLRKWVDGLPANHSTRQRLWFLHK